MARTKHARPQEFEREQIRTLKKELRQANQKIGELEKLLGYSQNRTEKSKREKEPDPDECQNCGKGILKSTNLGIRTIIQCSLYPDCKYRKVIK